MYTVFTVCIWTDRSEQTVDPDETPQKAVSHQDLNCLPLIQQFLDTSGSKFYLFLRISMVRRCGVQILRVSMVRYELQ